MSLAPMGRVPWSLPSARDYAAAASVSPSLGRRLYNEHVLARNVPLQDGTQPPAIGVRDERVHWGERRGRGDCLPSHRLKDGGAAALTNVVGDHRWSDQLGPRRAHPPEPASQLGRFMEPLRSVPLVRRRVVQAPQQELGLFLQPCGERQLSQRAHIQELAPPQNMGLFLQPQCERMLPQRHVVPLAPPQELGPSLQPLRENKPQQRQRGTTRWDGFVGARGGGNSAREAGAAFSSVLP